MTMTRRLRVGVIGCGGIAQMMHLPFLAKNHSLFEIVSLCDLSPKVLGIMGHQYHVLKEKQFTNYLDLMQQDLDVVVVVTGGDHTPQVMAALNAGKHVFVEKPLCYSIREANEMIATAEAKHLKLMVGYMKRFDPGYLFAKQQLQEMGEIRYVQMNTLHPEEEEYLNIHGIITGDDIPENVLQNLRQTEKAEILQAVGDISLLLQAEYTDVLLGSMVHDINAMRGLFGEPERVLFAEHWPEIEKPGGLTTTIQYPGALRIVYTWIFLPELRDYFQEIAIMSSTSRIRIQFPSPYLKNFPTQVLHQSMRNEATVEERVIVSYEEAFELELKAFHECVVNDREPITNGEDARSDIQVLQQILAALHPEGLAGEAYMHGAGSVK